jgi:transposase
LEGEKESTGGTKMEVLYPRCSGIDIHEGFVIACFSRVEQGQRSKELQRFRTVTKELMALRNWLLERGCTHVAMESTGIYWRGVYDRLSGFFELTVANAQHMKAVPGHKTDVQDAEWIADLLQHGLLKNSFVPHREQQELRDLTRLRTTLVQERARLVNRLHKILQQANIKLSGVLSDILGVSGKAILHALAAGETDGYRLACLVHPSVQRKHDQLVEALESEIGAHQQFLLQEMLTLIEGLERSITHLEQKIEERLRPFEEQLKRLEEITGVSQRVLQVLLAEVGTDMSRFPDDAHLASWAGMCPGQHESAGKRLSGRTRKGNRWLRTALIQAAHAAGRTQTYLGEQYRRIGKRRGKKRAAVAVGHSILVIFYHMMLTGEHYQEKGVAYLQERDKQRHERRLIQRLEHMGYQVTLRSGPAA